MLATAPLKRIAGIQWILQIFSPVVVVSTLYAIENQQSFGSLGETLEAEYRMTHWV